MKHVGGMMIKAVVLVGVEKKNTRKGKCLETKKKGKIAAY